MARDPVLQVEILYPLKELLLLYQCAALFIRLLRLKSSILSRSCCYIDIADMSGSPKDRLKSSILSRSCCYSLRLNCS